MGGYKRKNNPNKTHYRKGTTPKKGKPFTISEKDLKRASFSQDYDDKKMKEQQYASKAIPMDHKYFADTERRLDKKSETDLSGTKTNVGSPANFIPTFGQMSAVVKGIKNRDEYGGGFKGAIKGIAGEATGGTEKNRNEEINSKLDTIIAAISGGDDTMAPDISTTSSGAAPLAMASPVKFKEFMQSTTQSPVSNNTGGKNPNFKSSEADRMMAVADPNVDTKGALFMTHTPPSVVIGPVVGRDSTSTEKLYVTGDKKGWGKETMKHLEDKIWDQKVARWDKENKETNIKK